MMNEEFAKAVLKVVVGKVCQPLGVHGMQLSVCEALTDVLKTYLLTLGRTTAAYSAHANRTDPNLSDLSLAFRNLGVDLDDLSEFLEEVETSPLEQKVPLFPVPRSSSHVYVGPGSFGETCKRRSRAPSLSSEDEDCYDHIPPYLPPLPTTEGEDGKDVESPMDVGEAASDVASKDDIATPTPADPLRGLPQLFRQRGFSSDFSEDGELGGGSRRNSTSEGMVTTPTQFAMPDVIQPTQQGSEQRTSTPEGEMATEEDEGASERALIGSFVRTFMGSSEGKAMRVAKGVDDKPGEVQPEASEDVFAETTSKEGGRRSKRSPVGKGSLAKKTVKLVPSEPVLPPPPKPAKRDGNLPPPLRLMSPLSEPIIPGSQGQHPRSLSPVACSPRGQSVHRGLPKLSPLHPPPLSPLHPPPLSPLHPPPMSPMHPLSLHQPPQLTPRPDVAESFSPNSAHPPPIFPPSYPPAISTHSLHAAPTATIVAAIPVSPPPRLSRPSSLPESDRGASPPQSPPEEVSFKKPSTPQKVVLKSFSVDVQRSRSVSKSLSRSPTPSAEQGVESKLEGEGGHGHEAVVSGDAEITTEAFDRRLSSSSESSPSVSSPLPESPLQAVGSASPVGQEVNSPQPPMGEGRWVESSPISEDEGDKDISFEQDLISPSPPPDKTTPPPAERLPEEAAGIAEEVATLDSGVGGVGGVVKDEVIFDAIGPDDDIVQNVVSRGSPISDDDIVQISARRPAHRESPSDSEEIVQPSSHAQRSSPPDNDAVIQMSVRRTPSDDDVLQPSSHGYIRGVASPGVGMGVAPSAGGVASPGAGMGVAPLAGGVAPPEVSAEVLEVLEQTFSSEESDDSESEESEKELASGFVGVGGVVSGKGVWSIAQEERSRVVKDAPAKIVVPRDRQAHGQLTPKSSGDLLGLRRPALPLPAPRRGNRALNRPLPCSPLVVHFKRHMVPSLRQEAPQFKTKAEMKADALSQAKYPAPPHTPSSSPTSTPSPSPAPPTLLEPPSELGPLTISINRRIIRSPGLGLATPTEESKPPAANRFKKLLARFGGGATTPTAPSPVVVSVPPVHAAALPNPRKRELDLSDVVFPGGKRQRLDAQPPPQPQPTKVSSSSYSSSSDEDESGSDSSSITPPRAPPVIQRFPDRPRTPSSFDDDEESPLTPASTASSGSGLKLTISKAILPPATVEHLVPSSRRKPRKSTRPQRIPSVDSPDFGLSLPPAKVVGEASVGGGGGGGVRGRGSKGSRGRPPGGGGKKSGFGLSQPLSKPAVMLAPPPVLQGSDTICPECGLKDDGSPMIGCDHCDSWVHWVCGGITAAPPEDQKWYCPDCRKAGVGVVPAGIKKKGRKKKKQVL